MWQQTNYPGSFKEYSSNLASHSYNIVENCYGQWVDSFKKKRVKINAAEPEIFFNSMHSSLSKLEMFLTTDFHDRSLNRLVTRLNIENTPKTVKVEHCSTYKVKRSKKYWILYAYIMRHLTPFSNIIEQLTSDVFLIKYLTRNT